MILNFLQTREPPILPALHQMPFRKHVTSTGFESTFADDLDELRGYSEANKETLGQLLFHFFRRYGHEINYQESVISVRHGRLLSREEKGWNDPKKRPKESTDPLCVEEPFNTERNLGNTADGFAWRGIHQEIRDAFRLLAQGEPLEECCEQYVFPPEERPVIQRPPPVNKPVLTQSSTQQVRGH